MTLNLDDYGKESGMNSTAPRSVAANRGTEHRRAKVRCGAQGSNGLGIELLSHCRRDFRQSSLKQQ
jgi:hypothetical protein